MVNKRGRSHLKYAGQLNLEGPILAPNSNRSEDSLLESKGI
jgi:hypothetical protein